MSVVRIFVASLAGAILAVVAALISQFVWLGGFWDFMPPAVAALAHAVLAGSVAGLLTFAGFRLSRLWPARNLWNAAVFLATYGLLLLAGYGLLMRDARLGHTPSAASFMLPALNAFIPLLVAGLELRRAAAEPSAGNTGRDSGVVQS